MLALAADNDFRRQQTARSEAEAPVFGHIQSPSINCFREVAADLIRAEGAIVRPSHLRSGHGDEAYSKVTSRVSEAAHCTRPRWRRCSLWGLKWAGLRS